MHSLIKSPKLREVKKVAEGQTINDKSWDPNVVQL